MTEFRKICKNLKKWVFVQENNLNEGNNPLLLWQRS